MKENNIEFRIQSFKQEYKQDILHIYQINSNTLSGREIKLAFLRNHLENYGFK